MLLPTALVFFLMIRRPPRSTLFPYTRSSDLKTDSHRERGRGPIRRSLARRRGRPASAVARRATAEAGRSEEHTSELQSPCNLVCRLLLEKKKNTRLTHRAGQATTATAHASNR